jgi:hypothetical protein
MSLPLHITLLVLFAALMHAAWNAIVKSSASKLLDTATGQAAHRRRGHCCLRYCRAQAVALAAGRTISRSLMG